MRQRNNHDGTITPDFTYHSACEMLALSQLWVWGAEGGSRGIKASGKNVKGERWGRGISGAAVRRIRGGFQALRSVELAAAVKVAKHERSELDIDRDPPHSCFIDTFKNV